MPLKAKGAPDDVPEGISQISVVLVTVAAPQQSFFASQVLVERFDARHRPENQSVHVDWIVRLEGFEGFDNIQPVALVADIHLIGIAV